MAETELEIAHETADVQDAVAGTADLEDVPVAEHVARFDAVHRAMSDALSAIDGA